MNKLAIAVAAVLALLSIAGCGTGVGKGKAQYDKREDLKKREADRELKRATMKHLKNR